MEKKTKCKIDSITNMFITCDLWGTLLLDEQSEKVLDEYRITILHDLFTEIGQNSSKEIWTERVQNERKTFKEAEMKGIVLSSKERLHRITMGQLNGDYTVRLKKQFSKAALLALPKVNGGLLSKVIEIKSRNHCLAIASNTGLIDSETTFALLKKVDIAQYFDYIFLSEEIGLCKPDSRFFEAIAREIGIKTKKIFHIGDSYEKDYLAAIKAGCEAFLYEQRK